MKSPGITSCGLKVEGSVPRAGCRRQAGFTMIEIAICLAIIGIALVGIIAVLPVGMHTQRDTRQETIIAQDADYLMNLVRNGSHGPDDLTNYIIAATNYWYWEGPNVSGFGTIGYNYNGANATLSGGSYPPSTNFLSLAPINSGSNIVSLLSTPEFMDPNGYPLASFVQGGISNHVVFYMRAISGLAAEKTPQDNAIMQQDAFTYRVLAVNAPMPMDLPFVWTNLAVCHQFQRFTGAISNGRPRMDLWPTMNLGTNPA